MAEPTENSATIQDIITHAVNDEPSQVKDVVYDLLNARVAEFLDDRKKYVAKHMFKKTPEVVDEPKGE